MVFETYLPTGAGLDTAALVPRAAGVTSEVVGSESLFELPLLKTLLALLMNFEKPCDLSPVPPPDPSCAEELIATR